MLTPSNEPDPTALRQSMLELMVTAALTNHDLTPFDPLESGGYQSRCHPRRAPAPAS